MEKQLNWNWCCPRSVSPAGNLPGTSSDSAGFPCSGSISQCGEGAQLRWCQVSKLQVGMWGQVPNASLLQSHRVALQSSPVPQCDCQSWWDQASSFLPGLDQKSGPSRCDVHIWCAEPRQSPRLTLSSSCAPEESNLHLSTAFWACNRNFQLCDESTLEGNLRKSC